jgi:hypothetical protein
MNLHRSVSSRFIIAGAMLGLLGGCSLNGPLREDIKATQTSFSRIPKNWIPQKPREDKDAKGADVVYKDKVSKSLIAMNSVCFRYENTSLERLAHQYESGLKDAETLEEGELTADGRRAFRVRLRGTFDGVSSEILVTVLRKNDCLFDFSVVGVSPLPPEIIKDFDRWVQGFRYSNVSEKGNP